MGGYLLGTGPKSKPKAGRGELSWQIVPARLPDLIKHPKAMQAMLQMKKLDIAELAAKS